MSDEVVLIAYDVGDTTLLDLEPAPVRRDWMDAAREKFANRCLPLLIANQHGWYITTRREVRAAWTGGRGVENLSVLTGAGAAVSHFGEGILTWHIPWLFRTSPGWNLLVRGPANWPQPGIMPLEGMVETDWTPATFTMNWIFTHEGVVNWQPGDPIAMLVPAPRGQLERVRPVRGGPPPPELRRAFNAWDLGREAFNARLGLNEPEAVREGWQRDYFIGEGAPNGEHQRRLRLRPFTNDLRR